MFVDRFVALAGGIGAAKLLRGLIKVVPGDCLTIIGNTGDDFEVYGLHISPDLDIVMYTLAGIVDDSKGWGIAGDTFDCLNMLGKLGFETWFKIGDMDLAVHILRTNYLKKGLTLTETTRILCEKLNMPVKLVPMTDDSVRTRINSSDLQLGFQEYFVKRQQKDEVTEVIYQGAETAIPSPGVVEAINNADRIVICPSNPMLSIAPILSIPTVKDCLRNASAYIIGVSPLVGGKTIKGPADKIMASLGLEVSAYGVAHFYSDILDHFIIDEVDKEEKSHIEALGIRCTVTNTIMKNNEGFLRLAKAVMKAGCS
jgi:LPPG:FO 2-phospho-L-lactate transferase